jgi:hypothetical protein
MLDDVAVYLTVAPLAASAIVVALLLRAMFARRQHLP